MKNPTQQHDGIPQTALVVYTDFIISSLLLMMKKEQHVSIILKNSIYVTYIRLVFMSQEFLMTMCHADGHQAKQFAVSFLASTYVLLPISWVLAHCSIK